MLLLGSHVGMSGKEMFLGSVKEALSYGANTFMIYTGAPQNTRRKEFPSPTHTVQPARFPSLVRELRSHSGAKKKRHTSIHKDRLDINWCTLSPGNTHHL